MGPTLNGSTALQRFKRSNAVEICNGIMFNFYPGLPHIYYYFLSYVVNAIAACHMQSVSKIFVQLDTLGELVMTT